MMMHNPSELKHFNQLGHLIVKLERTFLMSSNSIMIRMLVDLQMSAFI